MSDTDKLIAQARVWRHDLMPHTVELLNALADELEQSQAETLDARVQTAWKVAEVREQLEAAEAALKDARDDGVVSAECLGLEVAAEYQRAEAAEADLARARAIIEMYRANIDTLARELPNGTIQQRLLALNEDAALAGSGE
jgi:predicted  nucleic acid-binding Zn-ribbon protein